VRHDTQHNNYQHNDTQHNGFQDKGLIFDTHLNNTLPLWRVLLCRASFFINCYAKRHYAECHKAQCRCADCGGAPVGAMVKTKFVSKAQ
jgi:hypothetical protein